MNTATATLPASRAPQPLLSTTVHAIAAVAVMGLVAAGWVAAERASHDAVRTSVSSLSRNVTYVSLPTVQIVGHRQGATVAQVAASGSFSPRDRVGQGTAL